MKTEKNTVNALSTDRLLPTFILQCFKHFLKKCALMSNAFKSHANYYSIAIIKGGLSILVTLQAKYFKKFEL